MTEQYRVHGLHLHPSASPTKITKGPDGKLTLTAEVKDQGKVRARARKTLKPDDTLKTLIERGVAVSPSLTKAPTARSC